MGAIAMSNTRRGFLKRLAVGMSALPFKPRSRVARAESVESPALYHSEGPLVASVRTLGVQFLDNPLNVTGQDGATSVQLPGGDALWIFGDTIEGQFESIRNYDLTDVLSNSAAVVPRQDVSKGIKQFRYVTTDDGKRVRQIIPFDADESSAIHRLWAIHGICVEDQIYSFYHKIIMDPERDVFETFTLNGMGLARARIGEFQFQRLKAPDGTKEFWKSDQPGYGVFLEQLSDGFIYLWGCFWTGMFLARTRPETIEDLSSYEYLVQAPTLERPMTEPRWDSRYCSTAALFDSVPNEMSASYNPHLKKHLAIHVHNRENKLVIRTAPRITGPWSEAEVFFRPQMIKDNDLFTAGKEHPELRRAGGKTLYVTYVNSSVYAPHLLEVTLA